MLGFAGVVFTVLLSSISQLVDPADPSAENPLRSYSFNKVFIPTGFDDNDETQVIVTGVFPDSGWEEVKVTPTKVADGFRLELFVRRWDGPSASALKHFIAPAKLGPLPVGDYRIYNSMNDYLGTLHVSAARSKSRDDYYYAPVDSLKIRYEFDKENKKLLKRFLVLQGTQDDPCYRFSDKTPITPVQEKGDNLIEVLPVMERVQDENCEKLDTQFEQEFEIPSSVLGGSLKYLIHVRTSGNPYNKLVNLLSLSQ